MKINALWELIFVKSKTYWWFVLMICFCYQIRFWLDQHRWVCESHNDAESVLVLIRSLCFWSFFLTEGGCSVNISKSADFWVMLSADIGLMQVYCYQCVCSPMCTNIKHVFKDGKNAWTSDLKWCNYIVCPAEFSQWGVFCSVHRWFGIKFVKM